VDKQIDGSTIESDSSVIFVLDRDLRLRLCNAAWDRFARENDGESLLRQSILGRPIFDFISGALAEHYSRVFRQTLQGESVWRQGYECSSAEKSRRFSMHIYPVHGELMIVNSLVLETPHDRVASLSGEAEYRSGNGILLMCSNCRRTKTRAPSERWDWAPGFVASPPANVSHGLCPPCYEYYSSLLID